MGTALPSPSPAGTRATAERVEGVSIGSNSSTEGPGQRDVRGKPPCAKGEKPHPRGCGWEHPTRGSCPGDEPVPILQRGPCPAHHLCSTVIPKSELRPVGFCPISPFLAVQVVLEPLHPLPEVLLLEALRSEPERLRSQLGEEQRRERFLGAELRAGSLPDGERFDSQICGGL